MQLIHAKSFEAFLQLEKGLSQATVCAYLQDLKKFIFVLVGMPNKLPLNFGQDHLHIVYGRNLVRMPLFAEGGVFFFEIDGFHVAIEGLKICIVPNNSATKCTKNLYSEVRWSNGFQPTD